MSKQGFEASGRVGMRTAITERGNGEVGFRITDPGVNRAMRDVNVQGRMTIQQVSGSQLSEQARAIAGNRPVYAVKQITAMETGRGVGTRLYRSAARYVSERGGVLIPGDLARGEGFRTSPMAQRRWQRIPELRRMLRRRDS